MASTSFAAAATTPASPQALDAIPLASRPPSSAAATAAGPRKRPVLLIDNRPHPASPNPLASSVAAAKAAPQMRRKRPHSSSTRPRWQTVLSVAAKNAVLLAVLLYLGDLGWRWSHPPPPPPADRAAIEGYEARVAEVEASLVRSFRALQEQVEAVDRRIDGEVGAARGDLLALMEEKRLALEGHLARLGARADELRDALDGFRRTELLTRDELDKFWDEVRGGLWAESGSEVDLDQVRALAREIAMKEVEKHAADGIGRVDYAVASAGGSVVRHSDAYDAKRGGFLVFPGVDKVSPQAQKMLEPSFGEPGQCFALKGSTGFVDIKLKTAIIPEAVTLEHVSKDVAYDRSTAPKDCIVSGWYDETHGARSSHAAKMSALAAFTYDLEKKNVQTFDITPDVGVINMVRLDFTSNHGNSLLTCIYRLRVHGHEPISPISIDSQT